MSSMPDTRAPVRMGSVLLANVPTWAKLWLVTLVVFILFLDLSRPTGWLGSDDAAYHAAAEHVLTGTTIQRAHHQYARMAIIVPVAVSMRVFGDRTWAVALPSAIAAIGCAIAVVLIGATVWGWWEGLCAATLLAVVPYFRVLSTTAYPDVHACFWAAFAVLFALRSRTGSPMNRAGLAVVAGLAATIAVSAKVTCVAVVPIVLAITCIERPRSMITWARCTGLVGVGMFAAFLIEGWFYSVVADDFWFSLHALRNTQGAAELFTASELRRSAGFLAFVLDRLALPLRPADSGWGILGGAFWPALIGTMCFDRRSRIFAAWGLLAYLSVAFMPVSAANGIQPMPIFHGRHVLTAVLPFTLCLARLAHVWALRLVPSRIVSFAWPVALLVAIGLHLVAHHDLNGFQDRDTRRIGEGIQRLVASGALEGDQEIFMTPSIYWRYRILLPPDMRRRLRVAVAEGAPNWWEQTVPGISSRQRTLPPPGTSTLLATPKQLRGEAETWDYGCVLPTEELAAWRTHPAAVAVVRGANRTLALIPFNGSTQEAAVLLAIGVREVP